MNLTRDIPKMRLRRHWLYTLVITALFLLARGGSLAHAAKYGSAPHSHDGKVCVISLATEDEHANLALPPDDITLPLRPVLPVDYDVVTYRAQCAPVLLAQSARSPPISR